MALKSRREMDPRYMWDFTHIFESKAAWEAAYAEAGEAVAALGEIKGTFAEGEDALKAGLDKIFEAGRKVELVYLYAFLHKEADNSDPEYQEMSGKAMNLYVQFSSQISFMNPEILALGEETLTKYMESEKLSLYRHTLHDIARAAAHTLDEKGEMMLAMLGDAAGAPQDAFGMLESVDMTFPDIKGEGGETVGLSHGNFIVHLTSDDPAVRLEAYEKYFGEFKKYINTFAAMYSGSVKFDTYFADVRGFASACEAALFASNVPVSVYDSLIEAIHDGLADMRKYTDLRCRALGMDKIGMQDLYCPIIPGVDNTYTFEEACELVKKACEPLGETYGKLLDRAFTEKWIDVYENRGKTTGAFSCGVYGVHPYVLLNFTGTLDDEFTLAHELGHAMHSYFSSEAQEYANHDYKIMVAEVASTVNEVLLTKYLLKTETDKARRAYVLNHFLEGFRTTVFRQTLFAEFERRAHDMHKAGTPLTADSLNALYRELNLLYYSGVDVAELHSIEWARIPHFYRAFYVYQYATGFCSAVAIAQEIVDTGDASRYLEFLKTGGSDYPIEELKITGVDLTSPDAVRRALAVFGKSVDEMAEMI
ncbi:MAG: oligoendopeptidase F [Clostridia bacterium]|nr:oligoendopeptidase F [Clostridia bacterium]